MANHLRAVCLGMGVGLGLVACSPATLVRGATAPAPTRPGPLDCPGCAGLEPALLGRVVPEVDTSAASTLRVVHTYTFQTRGTLELLGARDTNAWFSQQRTDGSTTVFTLTANELLHEYALDPETPPWLPKTVQETTNLFRKDVSTSPPGARLHAFVGASGALTMIESKSSAGDGVLPDWRPSRFLRVTETGEPWVEIPLSWPNVTIDQIGARVSNEDGAVVAVTVAGSATMASPSGAALSVNAPEGGRVRAILQLDSEGVPESFFALPEHEPGTAVAALRGPYPLGDSVVLSGEVAGLDLGAGPLLTPLAGGIVMLDASGNLAWAKATTGRVLATSVLDYQIYVLTQEPSTSDARFYTLDATGNVVTQATIAWPPACAAATTFELADAAVYGNSVGPMVLIVCTDRLRNATLVHVLDLG